MRYLAAIVTAGVLGCGLAVTGNAQTISPSPKTSGNAAAPAASKAAPASTAKVQPMRMAMNMPMDMDMSGMSMQGMQGMQMPKREGETPMPKGYVGAPVIHEPGVPSFHRRLPVKGPLPQTLPPGDFSDPRVQAAYAMAAQVRSVLYQQPCYCHCDQEMGHHSLLDCYRGEHASICEVCLMEGVYAYQQTKLGKTPGQIRAAIERGAWKTVNLNALAPQHY